MKVNIFVTNLEVNLYPRSDGNYDLHIGDYCEGQIFVVAGKYYANTVAAFNQRDGFATAAEAAKRFLQEKAFLEWEDEMESN